MGRRGKWADIVATCKNGHIYPANVQVGTDGRRLCPTCRTEKRLGKPKTAAAERLWRRVQTGDPNDCWLWLGSTNGRGYGVMYDGQRQNYVHRVVWELDRGPIPDGLEVDHLCSSRMCVNVRHLALVTHAENVRRSRSPAAINARKTHCPAGHPYDETNTYRAPGSPNDRHCRACMAIREAKRPPRHRSSS